VEDTVEDTGPAAPTTERRSRRTCRTDHVQASALLCTRLAPLLRQGGGGGSLIQSSRAQTKERLAGHQEVDRAPRQWGGGGMAFVAGKLINDIGESVCIR
jgi:hypothetical protein